MGGNTFERNRRHNAELRKVSNSNRQSRDDRRSYEEETDLVTFNGHRSFVPSSIRYPNSPQWASRDDFDIPSTSRGDYFGSERQRMPNCYPYDGNNDNLNGKDVRRSYEEETGLVTFNDHSSLVSSNFRYSDSPQWAPREDFDIPATSRGDYFGPKRQRMTNCSPCEGNNDNLNDKDVRRSYEEETDLLTFNSDSSFIASSFRFPDSPQWAPREDFDIPSTSRCDYLGSERQRMTNCSQWAPREDFDIPSTRRCDYSGPKRQRMPNCSLYEGDDDSFNGSIRYYPSNSPNRVLLVSKRALDFEMQQMNTNSQYIKEKPQFYPQSENFCWPEYQNFPQPDLKEQEISKTLPGFETSNSPLRRENFFQSHNENFDAIENCGRHKEEERFNQIYNKESSQFPASSPARENERFYQQNFKEMEENSLAAQLPEKSQRLERDSSYNRHSRNEYPSSSGNFVGQTQSALESRIYEYLNVLSHDSMLKDETLRPATDAGPTTGLEIARKISTNKAEIEVITLSDDDSVKVNWTKNENRKALDQVKQVSSMSRTKSLCEAVKRKIKICRQKINKYKETSKLREKETGTKRSECTSTNSTSIEKRCRWLPSHAKEINGPGHSVLITKKESFKCSVADTPNKPATTTNLPTKTSQTDDCVPDQLNSDLQIAIIDRNNEELKISKDSWLQIEKQLLECLCQEMEETGNTNIGLFGGTYEHEIKIVQCGNMDSLNFIKRFINKQHIAKVNMRLDVVPVKQLPLRSIIKVSLPSSPSASSSSSIKDKSVFKILKAQNSQVCGGDWILINGRQSHDKNIRNLFISILSTSLEKLKLRNFEIRYGINTLKITLPNATDDY